MARFVAPAGFRNFACAGLTCALLATAALSEPLCPDLTDKVQFDDRMHETCVKLWSEVKSPSNLDGTPKPLDQYEAAVGEFFNKFCYRDPRLVDKAGNGWVRDKDVRDTGPFVAWRDENNQWTGEYHGLHKPVVIWYSPEMLPWLERNRPEDPAMAPAEVEPVPDEVIIVKEMYTAPGSRCRGLDIAKMRPKHGIAYMVRDAKGSHDGWFWGYFGYFEGDADPNIDWPPTDRGGALPYAGYGQYCLNCHASAANNSTFSDLANIAGQPGEPLVFLSQDSWLTEVETDTDVHTPPAAPATEAMAAPDPVIPEAFKEFFNLPPGQSVLPVDKIRLPSQTYDNIWVESGEGGTPPLASEYVTSDQCVGCHDAGSTGLHFDMTTPNPHGQNLFNLSPYATWRTSPMGLAGRDPIFFAQLSSEEQFHDQSLDLIWNTCFGCHGIMGQRQYQLDQALTGVECNDAVFTPDMVTAVPWSGAQTADTGAPHFDLASARYGSLARDGISCVACHRTILTPEQEAKYGEQPQNQCVKARQELLNGNPELGELVSFGKTFTGSFLVSDPATLFGPFAEPKTRPMAHALGNIPEHDPAIASSEQCGTCHTVHLPVLWTPEGGTPQFIDDTYEQTTYPEWLFSDFRTGVAAFLPEGEMLPAGPGATPQTCAECHMESHAEDGTEFVSKIASIQERSNMPETAHTLPANAIDLEPRAGFARHTLVGLNLFLIEMADQFNELLGIPTQDPMLVSNGVDPIDRTRDEMVANAMERTAAISVADISVSDQTLSVAVRIDNLAGHKFPSGVSFRRAFVEFEVLGAGGETLWHSGATNEYGILVGPDGAPLTGELWYDNQCNKIVDQTSWLPHFQTITRQDEVQIYQEVKLDPGDPAQVAGATPSCAEGAVPLPSSNLTTSFLSICHTPKDNRLLPKGQLGFEDRKAIARILGLVNEDEAEQLATETGAHGRAAEDPDFLKGGGDTVTYAVPLDDLGSDPAAVRATLHYQATPPFFLQDRFCTGAGANRDRLYHISAFLKTEDTPIADWKFRMVSTGEVALTR